MIQTLSYSALLTSSETTVIAMPLITDAIVTGVSPILDPFNIFLVVIGAVLGLVFGALPGLGGVVALTLLLPLTLEMEPESAVLLFGATLGGVAFGGSISAILINTPGTGPNAATLLDGYPMARKGEAGRALSAAALSSAIGALIGIIVFISIIPVVRPIVFAFGSPETFMLAIVGLCVIAYVSGSVVKGILAGLFGVVLALTGFDPITGNIRYNFDLRYLHDGFQLIPVLIGLFAIGEVINLAVKNEKIAKSDFGDTKGGRIQAVRDVIKHRYLLVRSSMIGFLIGVVPAAGGVTANFIAYAQAVQTSPRSEEFGTGRVEGVIASEASNDAKDGGAMLPSLMLGIPGSPAWAVILGGLLLHGIFPGPNLVQDNLPIIFTMIVALILANIITSLVGILVVNYLTLITRAPSSLIVGGVLVLSVFGTYATRFSMGDVYVAILFGFIGYVMILNDWSRISLVLGLILAPIAETNFHTSLQVSGHEPAYFIFFLQPISLVLFLVAVLAVLAPYMRPKLEQS